MMTTATADMVTELLMPAQLANTTTENAGLTQPSVREFGNRRQCKACIMSMRMHAPPRCRCSVHFQVPRTGTSI